MTDTYSENQVVAAIARLTQQQLVSFVDARIVSPIQTADGPVYRQIDLVRIELLCDLTEQFELKDDALAVVISLIDQLHGVRAELQAVLDVIAAEPAEVRIRVSEAMLAARSNQQG